MPRGRPRAADTAVGPARPYVTPRSTDRCVSGILAGVRSSERRSINRRMGPRMKNPLLRLLSAIAFAAAAGVSTVTPATSVAINYSDLWAKQDEPGWGLNISQQADVMFATLFIYDKGELPAWYSVTLTYQSIGPNGVVSYAGDLYRTTGPTFNANPFTPIGAANIARVGMMSIAFSTSSR